MAETSAAKPLGLITPELLTSLAQDSLNNDGISVITASINGKFPSMAERWTPRDADCIGRIIGPRRPLTIAIGEMMKVELVVGTSPHYNMIATAINPPYLSVGEKEINFLERLYQTAYLSWKQLQSGLVNDDTFEAMLNQYSQIAPQLRILRKLGNPNQYILRGIVGCLTDTNIHSDPNRLQQKLLFISLTPVLRQNLTIP